MAAEVNAVLVKVYPTDYNHDLAQGFIDWNPAPPDNGSGIWRDINIRQTGPVTLGPLSVTTEFEASASSARVKLRALARNLENRTWDASPWVNIIKAGSWTGSARNLPPSQAAMSSVYSDQGDNPRDVVTLAPFESKEIQIQVDVPISESDIWWPRQWGQQPLFQAYLKVSVDNDISDLRDSTFGFRKVTSRLNKHEDRLFEVNGVPFQVLGAGYTPDIFLRWDPIRFKSIAEYVLDIGLNTIRLEGKMEQPEFYDICDQLGIMVLPGWECCDKWEAWSYSEEDGLEDSIWGPNDYITANASMAHEANMMQHHPSVLGFLIGSDYWPDEKATSVYLSALHDSHWDTPIIAAASDWGHPESMEPSGLKMAGPYAWVPPNYWYGNRLGAAFGFGSELGSGVGTPELPSLSKFLDWSSINDLWQQPNKGLYHMSPKDVFSTRTIYNDALWHRYGAPGELSDYLLSSQMMDYEATRAQFEAYSLKWSAKRPATGMIYWLLNSAWPSLHWNLFDYYLHPAGSYFGAKTGSRLEHIAYDYAHKRVSVINRSRDGEGPRTVQVDIIDLNGKHIWDKTVTLVTEPNSSKSLFKVKKLKKAKDMALLRLVLKDIDSSMTLSRNVYWLSKQADELKWRQSNWFYTPVQEYADYTSLNRIQPANVSVLAAADDGNRRKVTVTLKNRSSIPAVFIRLNLVHRDQTSTPGNYKWAHVSPLKWSDNYITLWPHEEMILRVDVMPGAENPDTLLVHGKNTHEFEVPIL
ncbi:exo-beta-D-glucosaminidase [Diaporthe helianthi]|uniref:Exo-beta-D-glucosaminidase n=1 Tax=Diaporthe helianthi TaxID=158607 RepID=A0A2P5I2Z6_DIAHE|nr:exo-beta-D-glucosaminidase [Diaporthe helianthi]